jgi:hypothetical protein
MLGHGLHTPLLVTGAANRRRRRAGPVDRATYAPWDLSTGAQKPLHLGRKYYRAGRRRI